MLSDNQYVFKTSLRGKNGNASWYSDLDAKMNSNKLEINHEISKSSDMFNSLKNSSGAYYFDEIKSVKFSSKQLYGIIYLLLDLVIFYWLVYSIVNGISGSGIEIGIVLWLFAKFASRIKTIKVIFFNGKSIHIPIKPFLGRYSSIDYKEEVTQFINILKNNINEKHIG